MAHVLPEDLTVVLLSDWLEVNIFDLSLLDVAWCNHQTRGIWLHALSKLRLQTRREKSRTPLSNFAYWLHNRHVNQMKLEIELDHMQFDPEEGLPQFVLRTTHLSVIGTTTPAVILQLLSWFPQLIRFDCRDAMMSDGSSPAAIPQVMSSLKHTLESLSCHKVTSEVAWNYKNLKSILWKDVDMDPNEFMLFVSSNPQLIEVSIGGRAFTDDVIAHLLVTCPDISLVNNCFQEPLNGISFTFLKAVANVHCAKALDCIQLFPFTLNYLPCSVHGRVCELALSCNWPHEATVHSLLSHLTTPLRKVTTWTDQCGAFFGAASLLILAEKHGQSLTELRIQLGRDVGRKDVQQLVGQCPNLISLTLTSAYTNALMTYEDFLATRLQCPQLTSLGVVVPKGDRRWSAGKDNV